MEKLRHRPVGVPCDKSGAGLSSRTSLMEERIVEPGSNMPGAEVDRTLEVFGETVRIRSDPAGALLDVAVIEEIVPSAVAAPFHRHDREDEISYVIEGTFRIWRGGEVLDVGPGGVALLPRHRLIPSRTLVRVLVAC